MNGALQKTLSAEVQFQEFMDALPAPIIEFDRSLMLTYANRSARALLDREDYEIRSGGLFLDALAVPEDRERLRLLAEVTMATGDSGGAEIHLFKKSGAVVPVIVTFESLKQEGVLQGIRAGLARTIEPAFTSDESRHLETLGRLSVNLLHDLNSHLLIISGYAEMARRKASAAMPDSALIDKYCTIIQEAAIQWGDRTGALLSYSRAKPGDIKPFDAHLALKRTVEILNPLLGSHIRTDVRWEAQSFNVLGCAYHIEDAVINLAINARDAMNNRGILTLITGNFTVSTARDSEFGLAVFPGNYLRISVRDTGSGISPMNRSKLFEPFFSTKKEGKGTGLGLANVFETVKAHHGFIEISSILDQGTQFDVFLPLAE